MGYRVEFAPLARRQLKKLERRVVERVVQGIETLGSNPRPAGVKKLAAEESLYRMRIGDYRVIYQVSDLDLVVLALKVGHRREVYS